MQLTFVWLVMATHSPSNLIQSTSSVFMACRRRWLADACIPCYYYCDESSDLTVMSINDNKSDALALREMPCAPQLAWAWSWLGGRIITLAKKRWGVRKASVGAHRKIVWKAAFYHCVCNQILPYQLSLLHHYYQFVKNIDQLTHSNRISKFLRVKHFFGIPKRW